MTEELTNIVGLSVALRLSQSWLADEADAGRIPFLRAGRQRLFNVNAVREALAKRAAEFPSESNQENFDDRVQSFGVPGTPGS